jgi:hypothetical protein
MILFTEISRTDKPTEIERKLVISNDDVRGKWTDYHRWNFLWG